ncbi:MAG: hypothetical protein AAFY42_14045 [Pseudomonadota bacterium]
MGTVPAVFPTMGEALEEVATATRSERREKTEFQEKRWRTPRELAVDNFHKVLRRRPALDQITRSDARRFRDYWHERVTNDGMSLSAANKQIGILAKTFRDWCELHDEDLRNPFERLRLKGVDRSSRLPFSPDWVRNRLLAPKAFDGINQEAREIFFIMINTALGPSEIIDANEDEWCLDCDIPHLRVSDEHRALKTAHRSRDIPLLGVSLGAAKRLAAMGGVQRYKGKASTWSAAINKYMTLHGLRETSDHTAYSLRHYVEDELLRTGADERVRSDILGHKYNRPRYGSGGGLSVRRDALAKIAI